MFEPFFFDSGAARLFGVWRSTPSPEHSPARVWLVCPPFAEEEKSAHRTLTELCAAWQARGTASLFFAYRGTGDSSGNFARATLAAWRDDIRAAAVEARRRAPDAPLGVLGLRGGATLAAQLADEIGADRAILLEPLLSGRQWLSRMNQRRRLRAAMTTEEGGAQASLQDDQTVQDFDGWSFGRALRDELDALDLSAAPPQLAGRVLLMQIGPRAELSAPLQKFAQALQNAGGAVEAQSVVMQPFWNLLDYARADEMIERVLGFE